MSEVTSSQTTHRIHTIRVVDQVTTMVDDEDTTGVSS